MNKRLFSASELAELKLPGLPDKLNRASEWIARTRREAPELVQQRQGRGGGWLVDFTALPEAAQAELTARETKTALVAIEQSDLATDIEKAKRKNDERAIRSLTTRQKAVMAARHTILLAIEAEASFTGNGRKNTILAWVERSRNGTLPEDHAATVKVANDRSGSLSYPTLFRWFSAYHKDQRYGLAPLHTKFAQEERNPEMGLVPKKNALAPSTPEWFPAFLKHYAKPSKPSAADALRDLNLTRSANNQISIDQVRRAMKGMKHLERMAGREGKLAIRSKLAFVAREFSDLLPTMIYAADGKTFDAEVEHPVSRGAFRPEITTIIDVATRRAVGWSVDFSENTFAVVDALRRACEFCGIPAIFYTDRGRGYKNKLMDDPMTGFLGRAGITSMRALPYNSQAKGVIERLNQVYTAAAKSLPTYIGKDMDKEAKQTAFKQSRFDLANQGSSPLLLPWQGFIDLIDETLANYNNRPHSSLPKFRDPQLGRMRHMTPNELWADKLNGFEPIIPDTEELDDMWRPYEIRKTSRGLVELRGNSYFAIELERYYGEQVAVGFDIRDASKVWVRELAELDGSIVPGQLIAVAKFNGNRVGFAPKTYLEDKSDKRLQAQLLRLGKKVTEVRAQHGGPLLELAPEPAPIIPAFDYRQSEPVVAAPLTPSIPAAADTVEAQVPETATGEVRRPWFDDDVSFANWLVSHPDQATDQDKVMLRDLLTTHSTNELLRMSGVDLTAVRSLVRSPSVPSGASNGENT